MRLTERQRAALGTNGAAANEREHWEARTIAIASPRSRLQ
jgi:hypothetical protein